MKTKLASLFTRTALAAGLSLAMAGGAYATDIKTSAGGPGDGTLTNFIGFDWHSDGQAWIRDFNLTPASPVGAMDTFTLDYHGFAGNIFATGAQNNLRIPPTNGGVGGTYEITLVAHLNETATCGNVGCSLVTFTTDSGTFSVYIDYTPDADPVTGTGYADAGSIEILRGVFDSGLAVFAGVTPSPGGNGTGGGSVFGHITFSNNTFIDPSILGANATTQTSLQLGSFQTADYRRSGCMELAGSNGVTGGACTTTLPETSTQFMMQADASTTFIPEPMTITLLGLGLLGMGAFTRRRPKA